MHLYLSRLSRAICLIFISFLLSACGHNKSAALYNSLPINTDGNPLGNVVLVEFLDYSDPASLKMGPVIAQVMAQRTNVRIVYHPIILNQSKAYLTRLTLAAALQDRYLAAHHLMINTKQPLSQPAAVELLSQAFIDTHELERQQDGMEVDTLLETNTALAKQWQVTSVPTFFIGRVDHKAHKLTGPQTLKQLLTAIDEESTK